MSEVNINRSKSVKMSPINVFISKSTKTMFDTTDTCSVCPSIGQHDGMPGMAQKCLAEELHQPDSTYGVYPYTGQHDGTTGMVQNCPIEEIHQSDSNCFSYMKCISINGDRCAPVWRFVYQRMFPCIPHIAFCTHIIHSASLSIDSLMYTSFTLYQYRRGRGH